MARMHGIFPLPRIAMPRHVRYDMRNSVVDQWYPEFCLSAASRGEEKTVGPAKGSDRELRRRQTTIAYTHALSQEFACI